MIGLPLALETGRPWAHRALPLPSPRAGRPRETGRWCGGATRPGETGSPCPWDRPQGPLARRACRGHSHWREGILWALGSPTGKAQRFLVEHSVRLAPACPLPATPSAPPEPGRLLALVDLERQQIAPSSALENHRILGEARGRRSRARRSRLTRSQQWTSSPPTGVLSQGRGGQMESRERRSARSVPRETLRATHAGKAQGRQPLGPRATNEHV